MSVYPINLELSDRLCVVVGGGPVGRRKIEGLLAAGARVRLVEPCSERAGEAPPGVEVIRRPFRPEDLEGAALVFAATADPGVNAKVAEQAQALRIWVNVADQPDRGDFTLPALLRRGPLTVAVSTGGGSPALAVHLRDLIAGRLEPQWQAVAEIVAALRRRRLTVAEKNEYNQAILRLLQEGELLTLVAAGDGAGIDRLLHSLPGGSVSLAELGIRLPKGKP